MVRRRQRERSVWEVVLPDADKLWPDALRRIDRLIDDEALVEVVAEALERRWPKSRRRGRPGTPAEVVMRMLVLKHLYRWSDAELEHEVRANLVYRAFARIGCAVGPDQQPILKMARALGPEVIARLHQRVVALAITAGVTKGRRMRVDTTVVETHIHYLWVSKSLSGGSRGLDEVPAVGDPPHMVQIGRRHRMSAGEGQWRVTVQRRVRTCRVVIGMELAQLPFQIAGIPEQHMVEEFAPHGPDQALDERV